MRSYTAAYSLSSCACIHIGDNDNINMPDEGFGKYTKVNEMPHPIVRIQIDIPNLYIYIFLSEIALAVYLFCLQHNSLVIM